MADRLTDEQYAAIEAAQPPGTRLARIPTAAGEIVIRAPTPVEEGNFQSMYFQPGAAASATAWRNLLVMTAVYPDKATLQVWLATWTGLLMNRRVVDAMRKIRGEIDDEEAKS